MSDDMASTDMSAPSTAGDISASDTGAPDNLNVFNQKQYEQQVLGLLTDESEQSVDELLQNKVRILGLQMPPTAIPVTEQQHNTITSSASTSESTVSESTNRGSTMSCLSQSTVATCRDSLDQRPTTQSSQESKTSLSSDPPVTDASNKRTSTSMKQRFSLRHWRKRAHSRSNSASTTPQSSPSSFQDVASYPKERPAIPYERETPLSPTSKRTTNPSHQRHGSTDVHKSHAPQIPPPTLLTRIPSHSEPSLPQEPIVLQVVPRDARIANIMEDIKILKAPEWDRFVAFREAVEAQLWARQHEARDKLREGQTVAMKAKEEANINELAKIEERQLRAEKSLEDDLDKERRNCLIGIRHMEAYCHGLHKNGSYIPESISYTPSSPLQLPLPNTPPESPGLAPISELSASGCSSSITTAFPNPADRAVTNKDFLRLAQQYHFRDNMETLHASRIKVLRERQDRQLNSIATRMEAELGQLEATHTSTTEKLSVEHASQNASLAALFEEKKGSLRLRLAVQEAIRTKMAEETPNKNQNESACENGLTNKVANFTLVETIGEAC